MLAVFVVLLYKNMWDFGWELCLSLEHATVPSFKDEGNARRLLIQTRGV